MAASPFLSSAPAAATISGRCRRGRCQLGLQFRVQFLEPLPVCLVALLYKLDAARLPSYLLNEGERLSEHVLDVLLDALPDFLEVGQRPPRPRPGEMGRALIDGVSEAGR